MDRIHIRKAVADDLAAIHSLVYELAVYEKAPNEVTASLADYQCDFADGIFQSHVACLGDTIAGTTIYYMTYSTWKGRMLYLEDFVVSKQYRRRGIGQLLFDAFLDEARLLGARLTKWQVLDWNTSAIDFYKKNGAIIETDWLNGKKFIEH